MDLLHSHTMQPRSIYWILPFGACFLACAVVDLLYFPRSTVFPDEQRILASAVRLAADGQFWVGSDRAWEMPGTALFFAPVARLFGPDEAIAPIRLLQAVLVTFQCTLVACIARRVFCNGRVSFFAACIAAVYPFLLFYQGLLLSETLFNTFLLSGVAALYRWRDRGLKIDSILVVASLCFALATLTKATLTLLPPVLLAATALLAGAKLRRTCAIFLAASCLYGAFLSPWWVRNAIQFRVFVPFSTSSGLNLYLGNNPHNPDAGIDWAHNVDSAFVTKTNLISNELARQRTFSDAAKDYIRDNPAVFLRAAFKKFIRFWNIIPNAAEYRSNIYIAVSAISFGPVLLFALACTLIKWREWRRLAPIYIVISYFTLIHAITIASLRYRFPLEPLLIVLAAYPITRIINYVGCSGTNPNTHEIDRKNPV